MRLATTGLAAAFAALIAAAPLAPARAADPVKIRLSYVVPIANLASMLLEKKDLAKHLDKSYRLEVTRFAGTPPMVTALAAGELDVANLAYPTLPIAIQNAGIGDLRVISDDFQDGSGVDISMRAMLRKSGLEANRDYTIVEAPFPAMRAMLTEKKVDVVPAVLPFSLDPELRKVAHTLFTSRDAVGISQFTLWSARKSFIDRNRAALVDFMEDAVRIMRWYLDPANHQQVMEICARITKQPSPERFAWAYTDKDYYRDRNLVPNLEALQHNVDLTRDLGFVKASFDVAKFSDLSIVQEAAKRLQ